MPAHAVDRRPALPALLLTVSAAALGSLALLPAQAAPRPSVAARAPIVVLQGESERAAVLARPPVRRLVVGPATVVPRPATAAAPNRPVIHRAARSKRLLGATVAGYACAVPAAHFTDTWGDPRPNGRRHQGTDMLAPYGSPVLAVTSGVIETNHSSSGGISLYLRGTDGDEYFYAHNSRNVAIDGQRVSAGELIAYVGTSGNARGGPPHVHFERHPGRGRAVDSYPFLVRACGG